MKKIQKQLLALLLTFFIYNQAAAQDWVLLSTTTDGDKYYIRNKPVESNSAKKFWIKKTASKIEVKKNGKTFTYTDGYEIYLYEFDCDESQIKIHSVVTYDSKGNIVDSVDVKEYNKEWKDVVPDSVGEMILKKACEVFKKASTEDGSLEKTTTQDDSKIYDKVEIEAAFPGGDGKWRQYLERNVNLQVATDKGAPEGTYTTVVQFEVDKEGNISNIRALTNIGYGMEEEAIRVIRKCPKWTPAVTNGKQVSSYKKQPISFQVLPK